MGHGCPYKKPQLKCVGNGKKNAHDVFSVNDVK